MHPALLGILIVLAASSSVHAQAVEPVAPRAVYKIENWETGLFIDRRPGNEEYGYPVIGSPFDIEDTQKWNYVFNTTRDGETLFYIGGTPGETYDVQFVNTDDDKKLTMELAPALFALLPVHVTGQPGPPGPAYILRMADSDLAITARREHSAQLKFTKVDPCDPLQLWRFYVPTF